ncbi:MAG TPA: ComEA family DNA-binding protein, partial [Microbacterium sp.]|nr:ComEA family DNA-binding protein [Microbacterium sp.]
VPPVGGGGTQPGAPPAQADARIDLNTADQAALETLPRIGPALAERIIAWREENGRFTSVDDLLAVPGIGEKMLAGLRDGVRV